MNKTMTRVTVLALAVLMVLASFAPMMAENTYAAKKQKAIGKSAKKVDYKNWNPEVKNAMNEMIKLYGKSSKKYNAKKKKPYVVFDFDNTCSIFDVEEQLAIYQLQTMSFAKTLTPAKLPGVLKTELNPDYFTNPAEASGDYCENANATYQDWIDDIVAAYTKLYNKFGPFKPSGLSSAKQKEIQATDDWKEFATKMRAMYDCVYDSESAAVAYPWVLYWFTGMTETEVYKLARKSHAKYKKVNTSEVTWETDVAGSKIGKVKYKWTSGTAVSKNIADLMQALDQNGIDVWVCSASATDPIRAAIDEFGLHDYVTGMIAMTNTLKSKKYINKYDYKKGKAWQPINKGKKQAKLSAKDWKKYKKYSTKAQPQGRGKVYCINNVPKKMKKYGKQGPIAGFMDSTGDYNFCTEYKNLKAVICFNRASRKTTDGGGVIAELACYQADVIGYKGKKAVKKANSKGDTLYVLQGRQENGKRSLRASRETLTLGSTEPKLWRDKEDDGELHPELDEKYIKEHKDSKDVYKGNTYQYDYMKAHNMTTKQVINKFVVKTKAKDAGDYGLKYGFISSGATMQVGTKQMTQWKGYHKEK